jgi:tetratricopeptide (TPR) repeat protein
MTLKEKKEAVNKVRELVAGNKIEEAIQQMIDLAKIVGQDYWDEALTISANYQSLENELRQGLLGPTEAQARRNRLIDQLLDLGRIIEREEPAPQTKKPDPLGSSQATSRNGRSSSTRDFLIIFGAILVLFVGGITWLVNQGGDEAAEKCNQLFEEALSLYVEEKYEAARAKFAAVNLNCPEDEEAQKWMMRIDGQIQALELLNETDSLAGGATVKTGETEGDIEAEERRTEGLPPVEMVRTARSVSERLEVSKEAANAGLYDRAIRELNIAQQEDTSQATRRQIGNVQAMAYEDFLRIGKEFYNKKKYKEALIALEKAESYKTTPALKKILKDARSKLKK